MSCFNHLVECDDFVSVLVFFVLVILILVVFVFLGLFISGCFELATEGGVIPTSQIALCIPLADNEASTEGLAVSVLASDEACAIFSGAFGASRELDLHVEGLILSLGFALVSGNILDRLNVLKVIRAVHRHLALVGSSTVTIDLEEGHLDGTIGSNRGHAFLDGSIDLLAPVDGGLFLAIEFLGATGGVVSFEISRRLVEQPKIFSLGVGDAETGSVLTIVSLNDSEDAMGADGGGDEEA